MIQLHTDCLVFEAGGGDIPCSAEQVAIELTGVTLSAHDAEVIRNAAAGVLHYFKEELGRASITLAEFSEALSKVLGGFGMDLTFATPPPVLTKEPARVVEADLERLANESGEAFELAFFPRLREQVQSHLREYPQVLRFTGLRVCVKRLTGSRRWTGRCQELNDQIVDYLRQCLAETKEAAHCALVVT